MSEQTCFYLLGCATGFIRSCQNCCGSLRGCCGLLVDIGLAFSRILPEIACYHRLVHATSDYYMSCLWISWDNSWIVHEQSLRSLWKSYAGLSMDIPWITHWYSMCFQSIIHKLSMNLVHSGLIYEYWTKALDSHQFCASLCHAGACISWGMFVQAFGLL